MVKSLVGADLIESERKFGGKHRMRGNFDIIITSNTRLRVNLDGDKEAWGRRLLVVRFNATNGTKRVSNFAQVLLREEAEGILAWIVEGARQFLAELDAAGDFKLTQSQSKAIDSVIEESASAEVFIKTGVVRMEGADATTSEIMDAYEEWCGSRGWEPESERDFKKHLDGRMRKYHRSKEHHGVIRNEKAARGYAGVTFVTANAAAPEPPVEKKQRRRAKKAKGRKGVVKMRQRKGAKNARGRKGAANNR
jgi:phage/plasmid-associated DNA primase